MQVEMLFPRFLQHAGQELFLSAGQIVDVSAEVGGALIGTGLARHVTGALPAPPERAVDAAVPETSARRSRRGR